MFKNLNISSLGISGTVYEIIELTLSHGFKGVDLDIVELSKQVQVRGLAGSRRLYDSAKLQFGSFRLPIAWDSGDDAQFQSELKRLLPMAELARDMGCQRMQLTLEPGNDDRPYHQQFEFCRKRLAEVAACVEPLGIRIGVGFLAESFRRVDKSYQFIGSLDQLQTLLGMVGRANVGLAVDLWQWRLSGAGAEQLRALSADKIVTVAVADAPAGIAAESAREEDRLLPGESGEINTPQALTVLQELGYDGPVTPLPHPSRFQGQKRDDRVKKAGAAIENAFRDAGLNPPAPTPLHSTERK